MNAVHVQYPDFANPELLEKIPLSARTILDIGCAQGALGADYLKRNPRCRVLGIDIDAEAIAHAAPRITETFCGDVEKTPMPFAVPDGIDCIIYGDVLEHLVDPWALVQEHAKYLSPEGTVLVCMPNVENWTMIARLLMGNFDYEDMGLMDRTHLRWFTPRSMGRLLTGAGLQLFDLAPRPVVQEEGQRFIAALAPGLANMNVDPAELAVRALPLQFIWRARKSDVPRMEISATMLVPQGGVSDVRVLEPVRALRTDCAVFSRVQEEQDLAPALANVPRIAILHRPLMLGESGVGRLRLLLARGYIIVTEFDDHPVFMEERGVDLNGLLSFKGVHAVQTSTPYLAERLRAENPEIGMFANGVFELPAPRNFTNPDSTTLFFGALNREADWRPLIGVLNEVARAVGNRLNFSVLHDDAFFHALETPHKTFQPMGDYAAYLKALGDADIAFMPLADTEFNRSKSDLKFIESAAARVTALASDVVYGGVIQDGKTGVIFRDAMELRSGLLRLLAYPEASRRMAEAARNYVAQNRMLAYQVADRMAWYRSLWERREELHAALRARVPELFV